jgi:hypothetical protein
MMTPTEMSPGVIVVVRRCKMKKAILLICCVLFVGCATTQQRLENDFSSRVDMDFVTDQTKYWEDYRHCIGIATAIEDKMLREARARAILGALIGAAIGAAVSEAYDADYTGATAGVGALSGAAGGVMSVQSHSGEAFKNCMQCRGYKLLW